jgi:hypothetical protein
MIFRGCSGSPSSLVIVCDVYDDHDWQSNKEGTFERVRKSSPPPHLSLQYRLTASQEKREDRQVNLLHCNYSILVLDYLHS